MYRIWFERPLPPEFAHLIAGQAVPVEGPPDNPPADAQAVVAAAGVNYAGEFLDRLPEVRVISRTGIGIDNISLPDATARGIVVCHAPDAPTVPVAEHTVALLLASARRLKRIDRDVQRGVQLDYLGVEVRGLLLGLVGFGRIGRRVARAALALEMEVAAFDPWVPPAEVEALGVRAMPTLEDLLRAADFVSLHLPLTAETRQLMNAERIGHMKPGAFLINTARGALVDEAALLRALEAGRLAGAGLDVFVEEPPDPAAPLLQRADVIATPHVGSATPPGRERLWRVGVTQALQVLQGVRPPHIANPEAWAARHD